MVFYTCIESLQRESQEEKNKGQNSILSEQDSIVKNFTLMPKEEYSKRGVKRGVLKEGCLHTFLHPLIKRAGRYKNEAKSGKR